MYQKPSEPIRLIEFISRSIEEHGHCTIRDKHVLALLSGGTGTCEARVRRLRFFACRHDWAVASHLGRTAVFTPLLKKPDLHSRFFAVFDGQRNENDILPGAQSSEPEDSVWEAV
jgi:hypothetical protein